ncbi:hypothetical protein NE237_013907 [Protea cynaroides]|uniref:Uncharacterized protein n=1 Tax=Protea cynaroides TaxID=273540 RepID=A0A9Q0JYC6_9MAGN|nr:hypothetical protein NE237_013907 [Protea cynaroides]
MRMDGTTGGWIHHLHQRFLDFPVDSAMQPYRNKPLLKPSLLNFDVYHRRWSSSLCLPHHFERRFFLFVSAFFPFRFWKLLVSFHWFLKIFLTDIFLSLVL